MGEHEVVKASQRPWFASDVDRMAKDLGSLAVLMASVLAGLLWIAAAAKVSAQRAARVGVMVRLGGG